MIEDCLNKGICFTQETTLYDNDNGFVTVAKYQNGEMIKIGSHSPIWYNELFSQMKSR